MAPILPLLVCLDPVLGPTLTRRFRRIALAMFCMTGRVTMLGLSRWAGPGGSYRTVQRFFATAIPWDTLFWLFFRQHFLDSTDTLLLGGDEVVVPKAGRHTHGLGRFFSSLYSQPIPSVAFLTLSLISTRQRHSFPICVRQVVRPVEEHRDKPVHRRRQKSPLPAAKGAPGRPPERKNTDKTQVTLAPELHQIQEMVRALLQRLGGVVPLPYLVLDGHFGNNNAVQMVRQTTLHVISKLRADSALYFHDDGPYAGHGPQRKYGNKLNYDALPERYRCDTTTEDDSETRIYQREVLHKEFAHALNVVIIVKTHLKTGKRGHVVLFSSDLTLSWEKLMDYYALRFQIEFNFRDAKQFWGLDDFMNTPATAVTNAASLALFMVNLAYRSLQDLRQIDPACSVLDIKAHCRGVKYVEETIKMLPQKLEPLLLTRIFHKMVSLGRVYPVPPGQSRHNWRRY